ncbi:hypothetical protein AKJ38_02620 [candidate division MSBL1 archaeon SCGC-AAA259I14]|uniref:Uncharacterized protein n=1 Tax=candidate division MSBL1 archaeon SCGC-AAA259I14 TaxID=1698268 RepID=A0A133URC6_9EURY|nr:hypothetical protein AKJ38_02620 [candidate division MSBL1 archaeon SCGC-AAA259I14]
MKKTTLEVSIQHENLNLMGLVNQIEGLEKEIVEKVIYAIEEREVEELCGKKHEETRYQRHGRKNRTLKTSIGTLELNLTRVRDKKTGKVFTPAEDELEMPKGKVVLEDASLESIEQISKLSYRKAVKAVKELSNSDISKSTLWRRVQDLDISTEPKSGVDGIMVDDTKVHMQEEDGIHFLLYFRQVCPHMLVSRTLSLSPTSVTASKKKSSLISGKFFGTKNQLKQENLRLFQATFFQQAYP